MGKKFDTAYWLQKSKESQPADKQERKPVCVPADSDIETVTQRIEAANVDITDGYKNWLEIGFALSSEMGEGGRDYFHRVSRFNAEYSEVETNRQYDHCLKSSGSGITIKSFFKRAKDCGISITTSSNSSVSSSSSRRGNEDGKGHLSTLQIEDNEESEDDEELLPAFSYSVADRLPGFLKKIVDQSFSEQDADILLLGAMTCISACLSNVSGVYDKRTVYPNLFLFVTARASSGKGRLGLCRNLVDPVHQQLRQINEAERDEYKQRMQSYNVANKKEKANMEKPEEPPLRVLIIPANASATAVYQVLNDNDGKGLMFESEGDTLANTLSSDYGNYSDGFRKAFHHETISYVRRKDREYVELRNPRLSVLLTGTPKQILNLISDAENGLFSRFIFYYLRMQLVWKDVFAECSDGTADDVFQRLGKEFFDFYILIRDFGNIHIRLTPEQGQAFNSFFDAVQRDYIGKYGDDIIASVRRLGLTAFRIMMILSVLRIMDDGEMTENRICTEDDFNVTMEIVKVLLVHTAKVFKELPPSETGLSLQNARSARQDLFYARLATDFCRQDYLEAAKALDISDATAERYIKKLCETGLLERMAPGKFHKTGK